MLALAKEFSDDLLGLFYPNICLACSNKLLKGEKTICVRCLGEMPLTDYWKQAENRLAQRFWGRLPLYGAAALFHFHKGNAVQHLLHQLKYKGRQDIGELMGKMAGEKLKESGSVIHHIDLIVPVPLFWKKQKIRGYNQCDSFAKAIAEYTGVPWCANALTRNFENVSQTKKKRFDRWNNVAEIFSVTNKTQLTGKHILLVDDVVTTGATSEACMQTILKIPGTQVSFVAIAAASR